VTTPTPPTTTPPTTPTPPTPTPAPTGRAAWPAGGRGGTLALDGSPGPYYLFKAGAPVVGSAASSTLDARAVHYGVRAIQAALGWWGHKIPVDGLFGASTAQAVTAFQKSVPTRPYPDTVRPLEPAGVVGRWTAYHLFSGMLDAYAQRYSVPAGPLRGVVELESAWDPGAVGGTTPQDLGLAQWRVTVPHNGVTFTEAEVFDPFFALDHLAASFRTNHDADDFAHQWVYVIAAHHAPTWARQWATAGTAPNTNIVDYVNFVLGHVG
jgi:soluble lytic murein transglycosylase-like protein